MILPGPQLSLETLVKNTAQLPQIDLSAAGTPASILGKSTALPACRTALYWAPPASWTVWPTRFCAELSPQTDLLRHRQPAPCHPGRLPHPHPLPRDSDHGWPVPHLAEKPQRIKWIARPASQGRAVILPVAPAAASYGFPGRAQPVGRHSYRLGTAH